MVCVQFGGSAPNRDTDRPTLGYPRIQRLQRWIREVPHPLPQLMYAGGEPSAPATPGLLFLSYTTPRDAANTKKALGKV
jgi:hypothetical protein